MRDLRWETISSNYIYENKWFHARADSCKLPDGRIIEPYFVVEVPDFCNVVIVTEKEEIVLVRQYRYPIDQTTYELPGGIMEANETPEQAALREMKEETGYMSTDIEYLIKVGANPALMNNSGHFFLARNAVNTHITQYDALEDIDIVLFPKEEFLALLKENKLRHGVQIGPIYEALIRLGWLQWK